MSYEQIVSNRISYPTWLTFAVLALLLPGVVDATVVIPLTFDQMISEADLIVDGTVTEVTSRWSDDHRTIFTYVKVELREVVLGQPKTSPEMILRFEGGEVGEYRLVTAGLPSFHVGERNLFFIRGNGHAISPLVGFFQGRLRVIGERVYDHAGTLILGIQDGMLLKSPTNPGATVSAKSPLRAPSAGEPTSGPYYYGAGSSESDASERERVAEPLPPEYPPRSALPSAESSIGPTSAVPAPEPSPVLVEGSASTGRAPSHLSQPSEVTGEPITVEEMIREIRKRLPGRQRQ